MSSLANKLASGLKPLKPNLTTGPAEFKEWKYRLTLNVHALNDSKNNALTTVFTGKHKERVEAAIKGLRKLDGPFSVLHFDDLATIDCNTISGNEGTGKVGDSTSEEYPDGRNWVSSEYKRTALGWKNASKMSQALKSAQASLQAGIIQACSDELAAKIRILDQIGHAHGYELLMWLQNYFGEENSTTRFTAIQALNSHTLEGDLSTRFDELETKISAINAQGKATEIKELISVVDSSRSKSLLRETCELLFALKSKLDSELSDNEGDSAVKAILATLSAVFLGDRGTANQEQTAAIAAASEAIEQIKTAHRRDVIKEIAAISVASSEAYESLHRLTQNLLEDLDKINFITPDWKKVLVLTALRKTNAYNELLNNYEVASMTAGDEIDIQSLIRSLIRLAVNEKSRVQQQKLSSLSNQKAFPARYEAPTKSASTQDKMAYKEQPKCPHCKRKHNNFLNAACFHNPQHLIFGVWVRIGLI